MDQGPRSRSSSRRNSLARGNNSIPVPQEWGSVWSNRIYSRAIKLDQAAKATNAIRLTRAEDQAAFRRLVHHLRHRSDAQNVDLMGLAGFCRNCLGDWVAEADGMDKAAGREAVYGMPYAEWKARFQGEATAEQLRRMEESVAKSGGSKGE